MDCCNAKSKQDAKSSGVMAWLAGPRKWWLLAAAMVIAGLSLGWESLVVWGIAPLLIGLLPCLIMCALGLCMMKCKDKKEESKPENGVQGSAAPAMAGSGSQERA